MDDIDQLQSVLIAFAQTGFQKATMNDLAEAANVSRQTLYNRYKSKEAVLIWAAEGVSRQARVDACSQLNVSGSSARDSLLAALSARVGILVPMLHGFPHGSEILDLSIKLRRDSDSDFHADFAKELNIFLLRRHVCGTYEHACDTSFLLLMSAKGLLMSTTTIKGFDSGMMRIIAAVLRESASSSEITDIPNENF